MYKSSNFSTSLLTFIIWFLLFWFYSFIFIVAMLHNFSFDNNNTNDYHWLCASSVASSESITSWNPHNQPQRFKYKYLRLASKARILPAVPEPGRDIPGIWAIIWLTPYSVLSPPHILLSFLPEIFGFWRQIQVSRDLLSKKVTVPPITTEH